MTTEEAEQAHKAHVQVLADEPGTQRLTGTDDHRYRSLTNQGSDEPIGIIWFHRRPDDGTWCDASICWGDAGPWTLVSLNPLHIEASLHCHECGVHGWIRGHRWEPA